MPNAKRKAKLTPAARRVKAEELQHRIQRRTGHLVAMMVRELQAIRIMRSLENNAHFVAFREAKRKLYKLYPGEDEKIQAIINFALVRSGWANRT